MGDVVIQEPTFETGSRNVARVAAICAAIKSNFSEMHGVVDQVMYKLNAEPAHEAAEGSRRLTYKLAPPDPIDPSFFPGMQAAITCNGISIGIIGVLHPEVLNSRGFDINMPA